MLPPVSPASAKGTNFKEILINSTNNKETFMVDILCSYIPEKDRAAYSKILTKTAFDFFEAKYGLDELSAIQEKISKDEQAVAELLIKKKEKDKMVESPQIKSKEEKEKNVEEKLSTKMEEEKEEKKGSAFTKSKRGFGSQHVIIDVSEDKNMKDSMIFVNVKDHHSVIEFFLVEDLSNSDKTDFDCTLSEAKSHGSATYAIPINATDGCFLIFTEGRFILHTDDVEVVTFDKETSALLVDGFIRVRAYYKK